MKNYNYKHENNFLFHHIQVRHIFVYVNHCVGDFCFVERPTNE